MLDWSDTSAAARAPRPFVPEPGDGPNRSNRPRRHRPQRRPGYPSTTRRMINCRADVNQLLADEIQMGVGEKYLAGLQQSLDADRSLDAGRHRAVESRDGLTEGRTTAPSSANLGFFAASESLGRQQHRAGRSTVILPIRNAGNICCGNPLRRRFTPTTFQYIVESLGLDEGELFNMYREVPSDHRQGSLGAQAHPAPRRSRLQDGNAGYRSGLLARPRGLLCHLRRDVVLYRFRADPLGSAAATRWSASPSSTSTSCATNRFT